MLRTVILSLFASGWAVGLLCSMACLVFWRRDDVSFKDSYWAGSKVAAHPERYVRGDRVLIARILFFVAIGLILASVVAMVAVTVWPPFK